MTEKRLYDYAELKDGTYGIFKDKYYSDSDTVFFIRLCEVSTEEQARTIVGQLIGLADEIEQLKQSYNEFEDECQSTFNAMSRKQNDLYRKNFKLKDENEQLKQQLEGIQYLIDKKIDEFKHGNYGDLPCNTIHMFLDLKQEIGDVE